MSDYRIRVCESDDEAALCALFERVFGQPRSLEAWRWKFERSRDLGASSEPHSLLASSAAGEIVGHAGAVVLPGWFRGRPIPMVQVCDVMVHPEHRGGLGEGNLFTLLLRALLDRISERMPSSFRYGFPGQRPYLLGERAKVYERMEIAEAIDLSPEAGGRSIWRASPLDWQDPRLDRLWARRRGRFDLGVVRDRAYLDWRYARNPSHVYHLTGIGLLGRLVGWVVSRPDGDRDLLVDLLLPAHGAGQALTAVAAEIASAGSRAATLWLPESWRAKLRLSGRETPVVTALMSRKSPIGTAEAKRMLYYTMGDVDIF
ncbi:GNAT family N-acetyltransferase [Imhoffiella purpurea]|uniref:N-acetyltransferase domain-containing protein n=1 Tax=Imhoffiella purpurea TaxID=1249627 RepID=W9VJK3_9GAMM|nr:GNAT family N-acetyltransferase [Imhoffiella purpurea]EXJ17186.1 hypothetical protein D779_0013 [Imhoffiella purpurea]